MDGFIQRAEFQAQNVRSMLALNKTVGQLSNQFKPRTASDVLVSEDFATTNPEAAASLRPVLEQLKLSRRPVRRLQRELRSSLTSRTGRCNHMQGDFRAALASYRGALDLFEADRGKLQDDASRGGYFANKLNFYYQPIEILLEQRNHAEAFDLFERSKSRALADLLASRDISFPTEQERSTFAALMEQRARIAGLQGNLFALIAQKRAAGRDRPRAGRRRRRRTTVSRPSSSRSKEARGKARDLVVSKPASLAQLQGAMREQGFETLMYLVRPQRIDLVAHQRRCRARAQHLPSTTRIERQGARAVRQPRRPQGRLRRRDGARALSFSGGAGAAWIRSRHLVIIPSAELHQVPFEALQNPADGRFLGEEFQLSYASSATILLGMKPPRSPKDGVLLAVADPEFKAEAEAVAALYPGRATIVGGATPATKKEVVSRLADYDVVHLSVHGEFNGRQPLLSHLKLAPADRDDGRLTAAEMFGLPLDRANLVVLSACQTGMGSVGNGDELIGMTRALLFAGARSFVLSRWKVDAASTALWMQTFHAEAQRHPLGEAARRAIVAVRSNPAFADPHHWAPFMLAGR